MRICAGCRKSLPVLGKARYCSHGCNQRHYKLMHRAVRIERRCDECPTTFIATIGSLKRTCSATCRARAWHHSENGRAWYQRSKPRIIAAAKRWQHLNHERAKAGARRRRAAWLARNHKPVQRICLSCGASMIATAKGRKKYCGEWCRRFGDAKGNAVACWKRAYHECPDAILAEMLAVRRMYRLDNPGATVDG